MYRMFCVTVTACFCHRRDRLIDFIDRYTISIFCFIYSADLQNIYSMYKYYIYMYIATL